MEIYNDNNRTSNTFLLCWLCFGWHNFYNNRYIMGIIQLLISCSSLYALFVFGNIFKFAFLILISIIWSIIDMIRIIFGKYRNAAKENLLWDIKEESKPAGFRVRVCAYLIDGWVISIISAILFLFGMIFFALPVDYNASHALHHSLPCMSARSMVGWLLHQPAREAIRLSGGRRKAQQHAHALRSCRFRMHPHSASVDACRVWPWASHACSWHEQEVVPGSASKHVPHDR